VTFDQPTVALANELRKRIQVETKTVDTGESVALLLWFTFIQDHARYHGHSTKQLARAQLEAFLSIADRFAVARDH